jgi:hypothetical protein
VLGFFLAALTLAALAFTFGFRAGFIFTALTFAAFTFTLSFFLATGAFTFGFLLTALALAAFTFGVFASKFITRRQRFGGKGIVSG